MVAATTPENMYAEVGDHVGPEFQARIDRCGAAVGLDAVAHVAHYEYGTLDFALDVLADVRSFLTGTAGFPAACRRETVHLGRQLHFMMRGIGETLENCGSGRIIRSLFDFGSGALLVFEIRPGEYLVGLVLNAENVDSADRALSAAVTGVRGTLGLPDQSPGGWTAAPGEPRELPPAAPGALDSWAAARSGMATQPGAASGPGPADEVFVSLAAAEVTTRSLDYAARFERSTLTARVDAFDEPALAPHFTNISRRRRRSVYQDIGGQFQTLIGTVDRALHGVVGRRVTRTVLDVEQGALYFQRVDGDGLLIASTLAQARVRVSQQHFDGLVERYARALTAMRP